MRAVSAVLVLALASFVLQAQRPVQPDPEHRDWKASWITHPTAPLREPIVLHFRRTIALATVPASYPVRVSADNRFILYVNGHRVGDGPARGDLAHWRYERFDLAPLLQPGENLITATVWNFGVYAPVAQMTDRTAFLLESEATGDASISTGVSKSSGWQVEIEPGQHPVPRTIDGNWEYMASGTGEEINAELYDWNWNSAAVSGSGWVQAASPIRESIYENVNGAHSADTTGDNPWGLVPDELPPMEYAPTEPGKVVRAYQSVAIQVPGTPDVVDGTGSPSFPVKDFPGTATLIPAGTRVHILLDRRTLTTAYPQLTVTGSKGAKICLTYAEALYDAYARNYSLEVRVGRIGNTYGPYSTWNGERAKSVAAICRKVAEADDGGIVDLWGDGQASRSFTYVDDVIDGILRLMRSTCRAPVNIASSETVTIAELFETICRVANKKLTWRPSEGPVGTRARGSDNTLCKQVLGWEPQTPLKVRRVAIVASSRNCLEFHPKTGMSLSSELIWRRPISATCGLPRGRKQVPILFGSPEERHPAECRRLLSIPFRKTNLQENPTAPPDNHHDPAQ